MMLQIFSAFLGSVGFALFFNMKGKQLAAAGIGGALTWIVYLLAQPGFDDYFVPYLIASLFVGLFAEIMARVGKAPATIFLTTAAVPLIPGSGLYYTMLGIVEKNEEVLLTNANNTITIALRHRPWLHHHRHRQQVLGLYQKSQSRLLRKCTKMYDKARFC